MPHAFALREARPSTLALPALLLAVALLLRSPFLGNPVIESDEQFYLLVGDHVLRGALPYVDVWDRKPVGLFLLYAAIRALGGEGILQYQLVATAFAAATAWLIARIASHVATPRGGLFAGITYLLWLAVFGGEGGQAPVFYNLPVALAGLLTLSAMLRPADRGNLLGAGAAAMLAVGLAMQIKYTAVFEGIFFGLALLWQCWRSGASPSRLLATAAAWIACALLPTAAALASYAAWGQAEAFVFANFVSVFLRDTAATGSALGRLALMAALLAPLLACAAWGLRLAWIGAAGCTSRGAPQATGFIAGWAAAVIAGVLLFGTWYPHYALPLLVPLSAAAAPLLGSGAGPLHRAWWRAAMLWLSLLALTAGAVLAVVHRRARGDGSEIRALAEAVPRGAPLYVFDGEPILYLLAGSPLPTAYVFPTHLNDLRELRGIGVDPVAELRRILASRPGFIVTTESPRRRINPEALRLLSAVLREEYAPVRRVRIGARERVLYRRTP